MYKLTLLILLPYIGTCVGVSLESAEETPCLNPSPNVVKYNEEAFGDPKSTWYHHVWSNYYLYRVANDLTRKNYDVISENDIKNGCVRFSAGGPGVVALSGFNGANVTYDIGPGNHKGTFQWKVAGRSNWDAETWVTKAGDDYFVAVTCFSTNQAAFTLVSLKKSISSGLKSEVFDHVKSLGFDPKYTHEVNVDQCTRNGA